MAIYTTEGALAERKKHKHCIDRVKMLPSGGQKDDLNSKENKTNTSRKKIKTLTEDSNQKPVKRKKKRRRKNKNNNSQNTTKIPQGCSLQT
jgi:recombination DNA repair RAD52 pathway protein